MRKCFVSVIFVLICLGVAIIFSSDYSKSKEVKEFENTFEEELPNDIIIHCLYDSYSSFPYEGERLVSLKFSNENSREFIESIKTKWFELPLSTDLNLIMFGGYKDKISYEYNLADKCGLPNVKTGYWLFYNENKADNNLLKSSSFDFSLAIFDVYTSTLYYYKINT